MILSPVILYPLNINLGLLVLRTVPWLWFLPPLAIPSRLGEPSHFCLFRPVEAITQTEGASLNVF